MFFAQVYTAMINFYTSTKKTDKITRKCVAFDGVF